MLNRKSMNLHMRKIHNISVAVKRKIPNFIDESPVKRMRTRGMK